MKALLSPAMLVAYILAVFSPQFSKELFSLAASPLYRNDVMGRVSVANKEACRRLCWYRELCTSYSYCSTCPGNANCLLHSSHVDDDGVTPPKDPAWTEEHASSPSPAHVCALQPCGPDQTCLPSAQGSALCLPLPAHCHLTSAPSGARLNTSGMSGAFAQQGQITQVECLPDYVLSPPGVDVNVQCQVNSKWTKFKGECVQVNFTNPKTPLKAPLPWGISEGWGLCVKGKYLNNTLSRIVFTPHACKTLKASECNITFRIATRRYLIPEFSTVGIYWRLNVGSRVHWLKKLRNQDLPLQLGDTFTYAIKFLPAMLRLSVRSRVDYMFNIWTNDTGDAIDLTDATHVHVTGGISLSYVNILENC